MNAARFEELVEGLLEGDLTPREADELAAAAHADPKLRRALRQELVLWELWSQQLAPERSAEAFVRGLQTRQRAEMETDSFVSTLHEQLERVGARTGADATTARGTGEWWRWCRRAVQRLWEGLHVPTGSGMRGSRGVTPLPQFPKLNQVTDAVRMRSRLSPVRWCAVATSAVVAVLALWLWTVPHAAHATVTLKGEAICTACELHETREHLPAIRVREGDRSTVYYVQSGQRSIVRLGDYCMAPFPVIATGAAEQHGGRHTITVDAATREPRPPGAADGRVLFPF